MTESARKQEEMRAQSKQIAAALAGTTTGNIKESRNKNQMQAPL